MTHEQGAIAQNIIDIFVAINIINFAAIATGNEGRHTAHTAEGAYRAVNAAGDVLACFLKSSCRFILIHNKKSFPKTKTGEKVLDARNGDDGVSEILLGAVTKQMMPYRQSYSFNHLATSNA